MRLVRAVVWILVASLPGLTGCYNRNTGVNSDTEVTGHPGWLDVRKDWQGLVVGRSTRADVAAVFKTTVTEKDRYAYTLHQDKRTDKTFLIMVDLDEDSIVTAKYYWEWVPASAYLAKVDSWEMMMDTQIPASVLQQYTANLGPREEAVLEYFGRGLYDIAHHFGNLNEVFGATASMTRIYTSAALQYNMRADKQALLSERGFVFDGGIFGGKCTMSLRLIDERAGWYLVVLKGRRKSNFFSGW